MPTSTDSHINRDADNEKDPAENSREKGGKSKSSSSKTKDLSHVPCKFFKVGSCTAGASCPFSHAVAESGAQKDVCTWFVKGNCKFGHKCALAHILPGQSMSMDRKNKKAAQAAAASAGGNHKDSGKGGRGQKREGAGDRNSLVSGSTAPTRMLGSSRSSMPMPLKATISPSVPAPPLKDTEFAQFGLPDDDNKLDTAPAQGKRPFSPEQNPSDRPRLSDWTSDEPLEPSNSPPEPMGVSTTNARRPGFSHLNRPSNDFGPIGSPTRSVTSGTSAQRTNGLSPGTSPVGNTAIPPSPFSAPGTQSAFLSYDKHLSSPNNELKFRSGIAASLGATQTTDGWSKDFGPIPSQVTSRAIVGRSRSGGASHLNDNAVEDGDLEDFLPSSLNDLLTPEERSRRMSRSHSGQPTTTQTSQDTIRTSSQKHANQSQDNNGTSLHRYSRSVPAPSLLGDLRSIWSSNHIGSPNTSGLPASPDRQGMTISQGTPSSYISGSNFGGQSFTDDGINFSLLSPSNASAAFLPGFHQHYKSGVNSNLRVPTSNSLTRSSPLNALSSNQFQPSVTLSTASHMHSTFASRVPPFQSNNPSNLLSARPTSNNMELGPPGLEGKSDDPMSTALSPSARALQAHAPGQSLPQGLAAGYSRIHALPSAALPSPGIGGGFSPGYGTSTSPSIHNDWSTSTDLSNPAADTKGSATTGLEGMFSRLSYSAAASRSGVNGSTIPTGSISTNPPSMSRNVSGGRHWGTLSPLSGPVVTSDDDELFSFDG